MRAALVAVSGLAFACSLLVNGATEELGCTQEGAFGPPACDPGFQCMAGVCRAADDNRGEGGTSGEAGATAGDGGALSLPPLSPPHAEAGAAP